MRVASFISVVIPTCHRNDLLARCLDRLAPGRQTLPADGYEVIVTDDGSGSTAEGMIRQRFSWARWFSGPRRGPAANRNHGVRQARGSWVAFTDDDCIPAENWLESFDAARREGVDVYEGRTTCAAGICSPLDEAPINLTGGCLWSCNMMFAARAFHALGGFDERFPHVAMEDVELHQRVIRAGLGVCFVKDAVVDHPPRRRRLGHAAAKQWESRVLFEVMKGSTWAEWLPAHVIKVRLAQLAAYPVSLDWVPCLWSLALELAIVAVRYRAWHRAATALADSGPETAACERYKKDRADVVPGRQNSIPASPAHGSK